MKPISAHRRLFTEPRLWPPCSAHRETLWDTLPKEPLVEDPLAIARGLRHALCLTALAGEVLGLLMWGGVL
jgi:hypothetical protein